MVELSNITTDDGVNMLWSKPEWGGGTRVFCTRRVSGKTSGFVAITILSLLPALAISADRLPPAPPEGDGAPTPGPTPKGESAVPPSPPSKIDPGILHVPDQRGDPRAAVKPPDIDPGISKNPDAAPPAQKDINPSNEGTTQGEPEARWWVMDGVHTQKTHRCGEVGNRVSNDLVP